MSDSPAGKRLRADGDYRILRPLRNCVLSKIEVERLSGPDASIDVDPPFYLETGLTYSVFVPIEGNPELWEVAPNGDDWVWVRIAERKSVVADKLATRH